MSNPKKTAVSDIFDYKRMRDKYNDHNNFNINIESTNHCYYCYFFSANTGLWHRFAVTLKENKEKCFLVFRDIVIEVKLSESES